MKRILNKGISIIVSIMMLITMIPSSGTTIRVNAQTVKLTSQQITDHFNSKVGSTYMANMCLGFIAGAFSELGATKSSACCAWNYGNTYCTHTSRNDIPVGADVFFSSEGCAYDVIDSAGHHCGHIGVYVGDGYMVHAYSGKIQKMKIDTVVSHGYTYRGWGVHGNVSISDTPIECGFSLSGTTLPADGYKHTPGKNFGLYGTIHSNHTMTELWGGVYNLDGTAATTSSTCYDKPNSTSYNLGGKFNNDVIFDHVPAGNYYFSISVKDSCGTLKEVYHSNITVGNPVSSNITVSGESLPPDQHTLGKFFPVKGIIKSNLPITWVWGGVYYQDWSKPVPNAYAEAVPNTTTYDLSTYFDSKIIFNTIPEGYYHYLISARDSSGKDYVICNKDFKVGNPPCTSHSFGDWTVNKAATCTTDGSQTRKCNVCGYSETGTITKAGHNYAESTVAATCTTDGKTEKKCKNCNDTVTTVIKATGHKYGDWTVSKNVTCIADGSQVRTCSVCNHTETKEVTRTGHKYVETVVKPTCTEKGYTIYKCSVCADTYNDKYTEITSHNYESATINGKTIYVCTDCGNKFEVNFKGIGTEKDPYQISNKEELSLMRDLVNTNGLNFNEKFYIQTADIDLENELWEPIGTRMKNKVDLSYPLFAGNYDGNNHVIKNLYVNKTGEDKYAGLFGSLRGKYSIENLIVYGSVSCDSGAVGGIAGEVVNGGGSIRNCAFIGDVSGTYAVGGITGVIYQDGMVENCYHIGTVSLIIDGNSAGGLVGDLVAGNEIAGNAVLRNSYHIGKIEGNGDLLGGVIGNSTLSDKVEAKIIISNCFFNKDDISVGGKGTYTECEITPLSSSLMKKISDELGEPFVNNTNTEINNGYPVFEWQLAKNEEKYIIGDVNNNGVQDITDLSIIALAIIGDYQFNAQQSAAADIDGDGKVGLTDLARYKQFLSKVITSLR